MCRNLLKKGCFEKSSNKKNICRHSVIFSEVLATLESPSLNNIPLPRIKMATRRQQADDDIDNSLGLFFKALIRMIHACVELTDPTLFEFILATVSKKKELETCRNFSFLTWNLGLLAHLLKVISV